MAKNEHPARSAAEEGDPGPGVTREPDTAEFDTAESPDAESPDAEDTLADFITHEDRSSSTVAETLDSVSASVSRPLVKRPTDFKGKRLGTYEILNLIGKGGIGLVYLAFDHRLRRRVALKLLRTDDPEAAERLLEEARAQARVEHENVCQVYEAGDIDGQTFIAMQYIDGRPLTKAFADMSLEEQVRVIQRVAEGLQAAHSQNLIHRDVKPGNILVEKTARGEWKPYILDFGLAREQAAPGETTTGEVKGTPNYMPPEQVAGQIHSLDARADLYSLGATFYEGVSGRQLFPESTGGLAVMLKVLNEDPEPLRAVDKSIPTDLESIIMRCLEKDPDRRYASARDLFDDLQRFLDGEPIMARAIGPMTRLWRRVKKRRVAVLAAGLVATVLVSVALLTASHLRNRAKARLMDQYRQDVRYIDELIKHVYEAPLHDVTKEKDQIRERLETIGRRAAGQGRLARGPSHFALGRGQLALHEYEEAYHHLVLAWESGTRDPEVGYALGRALGALYEKELRVARRIQDDAQREARVREIEDLYREPALEYLRRSSDVEVDSIELVEARMALWEERYEEALAKAEAAHRKVPWLYEALAVQGDVHTLVGGEHFNRGENDEALIAYRRAQEVYADAAEKGRSDARIYEGQCSLGFSMMELGHYGLHEVPREAFEYGLEACDRARKVDPERPEPYELESRLYWRLGDSESASGIDPTEHLLRAYEAAARALEIAPDHVETYASLGWSQALLAQWQIDQGLDPRTATDRALAAFRDGIELDPQYAQNHNGLGFTLYHLAEWQIDNGEDASASLNTALEALERAMAIEPEYLYALDNLGNTYVTQALWDVMRGKDPSSSVEEAVRVFTRLQELNPTYIWAPYGIGDAWTHLALHQLRIGKDPSETVAKARSAFARARAVDPEESWVDLGLGRLDTVVGRWQAANGGAAEESFQSARRSLEQSLARQPEETWGYQVMAELDRHWARWKLDQGLRPAREIDHGLSMVAKSLELDPGQPEVIAIEGALLLTAAESENDSSRRRRHTEAALKSLERALVLNSNLTAKYQPLLDRVREPS